LGGGQVAYLVSLVGLFDKHLPIGVFGAKRRLFRRDTAYLPAEAERQRPAVADLVHLEFQAGTACVDDKNHLAHSPPPAACARTWRSEERRVGNERRARLSP